MFCANYPSQFMAGIKELQLAVNGKSLTVEKCRDLSWFGPLFSSGHVGLHSQKVWPILDSSTVQRSPLLSVHRTLALSTVFHILSKVLLRKNDCHGKFL